MCVAKDKKVEGGRQYFVCFCFVCLLLLSFSFVGEGMHLLGEILKEYRTYLQTAMDPSGEFRSEENEEEKQYYISQKEMKMVRMTLRYMGREGEGVKRGGVKEIFYEWEDEGES